MVTLRHSIVVRKDMQINCLKIHAAFRAFTSFRGSRDGSVGIATRYRLEGVGIESRWGRDFPPLSRPAPRPTQPSVQGVPSLSRG